MRIAEIIQDASDSCDIAVLKLELHNDRVDNYTRARIRLSQEKGGAK
jgi:hypothetical protein